MVCTVDLWLGNGDGTFNKTTPAFFNTADAVWAPYWVPTGSESNMAYDTNGDGVPDIAFPPYQMSISGGILTLGSGYILGRIDGTFELASYGMLNCDGAYTSTGDFNGDGLSDTVCSTATVSGTLLATGNGYSSSSQYAALPAGNGFGIDLNGDGKSDVLYASNILPNEIQLSSGDGSFADVPLGSLRNIPLYDVAWEGTTLQTKNKTFLTGNFSGSGSLEFLSLDADPWTTPNKLWIKSTPMPPDMLSTVTSATGVTSRYSYESLTNTTRYAGDRGSAYASSYPKSEPSARPVGAVGPSKTALQPLVDATPPMFIVTAIEVDTGVGTAKRRTEYAYRGYKNDQLRGSLGFREIRQQSDSPDGVSKLTTVQRFLQGHPYTGSNAVTETYLGAMSPIAQTQTGALLATVQNTYCDSTAAAGAENAATISAPCPVTSKVLRPYLRQSVQTATDLNGTALPTLTTTTTYAGGYPTLVETQTVGNGPAGSQTFVKRAVNEYFADNIGGDNWLLGLLKKTTASSTVPNSLAATVTTAGSAPKATATAGP